ncbi:MAG TPA: hypothetical protein DHC76_08020 [Rhodobacteraceae bacterium]|jgi:hypothetical protein|nr:hypothetical protein [Paracoccaceae bacterium]
MTVLYFLLGRLLVLGDGLAIYERRKGKVLLEHDLNLAAKSMSEADRELERSTGAMRNKLMFDSWS